MRSLLLLSLPLLAATTTLAPRPLLGADQPCWDRVKEMDQLKEESGGILPPGASYPNCDRLGRYAPKQCTGSECYCVDPHGEDLMTDNQERYFTNIWEGDGMACNCARREHEIRQSDRVGVSVKCDEKGDYHHTQCLGSSCYCVHPVTGEPQEGSEQHIAEFAALHDTCSKQDITVCHSMNKA